MTGPIWAVLGALILQQGASQVDGRVEKPTAKSMAPVPNVMVTLHRVGPDSAAPLDSTRTDAAGRFRFSYHRFGSTEAIYFVSSTYGGIAYFSEPLKAAVVHGGDADVTVFDTSSGPMPMSVRGRHLIVSAPATDGQRDIVEVFEVSNDSDVTVVSPGTSNRPTWSAPVPVGAQRFSGGQGDVPADAIALVGGRAQVVAPFAPGVKQLSFRYSLPASAFPLALKVEKPTSVLEVLVEEPMARLSGATLQETNPVSAGGRTFRRFLAQDVQTGRTIEVGIPGITAGKESLFFAVLVLAIGGAMLIALARAFSRGTPGVPRPATGQGRPIVVGRDEQLARQIVDLDDAFAARPENRPAYEAARAALKGELTAVLTRGGGTDS